MTEKAPSAMNLALAKMLEGLAETEPGRAEEHRALAAELRGETYTPPAPKARTYVAIESAHVFGAENDKALAEGLVFELQPDRSLKPLDGPGLVQFAEDHPGFARRWRIETPE